MSKILEFLTCFHSQILSTQRRFQALFGILGAIFFSLFIYLEYFKINSALIPTISILLSFFIYFNLTRFGGFIFGFFIGIFWFYWTGFSFRYYNFSYFIPIASLLIALVYGILFYFFTFFKNIFFRILTLSCASFIQPFNFNWFIPEITLINSYFFASKINLILLLSAIAIFSFLFSKQHYKSAILPLFLGISFSFFYSPYQKTAIKNVEIKTTQTQIPQALKWSKEGLNAVILNNFTLIDNAINTQQKIVILPETAFPIALNTSENLITALKQKSEHIAIITGGVTKDENRYYNSAYVFNKGQMQVVNKVILVPFGESIPLPRFLANIINKIFFNNNGGFDLPPNDKPQDIFINDEVFRIAICYEATRQEFFKDSPKNLIAISNNAWFHPSIESTLQKLLMQYFSNLYGTNIYHSSNFSQDFILNPSS